MNGVMKLAFCYRTVGRRRGHWHMAAPRRGSRCSRSPTGSWAGVAVMLLISTLALPGCSRATPEQRHAEAMATAGQCLHEGRLDAALEAVERAIVLRPNDPAGYVARGNIRFEMALSGGHDPDHDTAGGAMVEHYRDAAQAYRQALDLDPGQTRAWVGAGFALRAQGKHHEADTCFARAIDLYTQRLTALRQAAAAADGPPQRNLELPLTQVYIAALTAVRGESASALAQLDMVEAQYPYYAGVPFWREAIQQRTLDRYLTRPATALEARPDTRTPVAAVE